MTKSIVKPLLGSKPTRRRRMIAPDGGHRNVTARHPARRPARRVGPCLRRRPRGLRPVRAVVAEANALESWERHLRPAIANRPSKGGKVLRLRR